MLAPFLFDPILTVYMGRDKKKERKDKKEHQKDKEKDKKKRRRETSSDSSSSSSNSDDVTAEHVAAAFGLRLGYNSDSIYSC